MIRGTWNLAELLILSVGVVVLSSFGWRMHDEWQEDRAYEDRNAAFRQVTVSPLILTSGKIARGESLSGRWVRAGRRGSSALVFEQIKEGNGHGYGVEFTTRGCTASHHLKRTAESRDGTVVLNKPVAEALGPAYQRLCCFHAGDKRALVPATTSADAKRLLVAIRHAENSDQWDEVRALAYIFQE